MQPKPGNLRCSWCDPLLLGQTCETVGGRSRLKQLLRNMAREVQIVALQRLPEPVYQDHFEAEFGAREVAEEAGAESDPETEHPEPLADDAMAALPEDSDHESVAGKIEFDMGEDVEMALSPEGNQLLSQEVTCMHGRMG